ncbi:MAG: hypothetical protein IKA03_05625, partial [Alphaproteobacteria bacterium]|nr:hypothetical protein [Alphaproteobacteria bacterium]
NGIDYHIHNWRERQVEQPPVHKEEYKTAEEGRKYAMVFKELLLILKFLKDVQDVVLQSACKVVFYIL